MDEIPVRPNLLIVDDSPFNLRFLTDMLKDDYEVHIAQSGREALALLVSQPLPDTILLDIVMDDIDGYEVCRELKASVETRDIPIIFLTTLNQAENEALGLSLGAIDYITKPFNPAIVKARIKNHLQLKYYRDSLARISMLDGLTGIANRSRFDETLVTEWKRSLRSGKPISLIIVDIDDFKMYNDTYGHMEGDTCLRTVASQLNRLLKRPGDFLARWGGEEFGIILPETDGVGAMQVAEDLRKGIMDLGIPHSGSPESPFLTVSIGAATMSPRPGDNPEELTKRADEALYTAKRAGGNRTVQRLVSGMPRPIRKARNHTKNA